MVDKLTAAGAKRIFFDVQFETRSDTLDDRHVALYILDVSGHGVAAALLLAACAGARGRSGQPAPDRLKKASGQAQTVRVFTYGRGMDVWWKTNGAAIRALPKVSIHYFAADELQQLCALADKTMKLSVTITETIAYVSSATENLTISLREMEYLK